MVYRRISEWHVWSSPPLHSWPSLVIVVFLCGERSHGEEPLQRWRRRSQWHTAVRWGCCCVGGTAWLSTEHGAHCSGQRVQDGDGMDLQSRSRPLCVRSETHHRDKPLSGMRVARNPNVPPAGMSTPLVTATEIAIWNAMPNCHLAPLAAG